MIFRKALLRDAAKIAALHAKNWQLHYRGAFREAYLDCDVVADRRRVWLARLNEPAQNQHVIIAEQADELLGFVCVYGHENDFWGSFLDNLHVVSEAQSAGIGRALIGHAGALCMEKYPGVGMYLWVLAQNQRARKFYVSVGGREVEKKVFDAPGGGQVDEVRFSWCCLERFRTLK